MSDMRDLRFLILLLFMLLMGSSSLSDGHGGITRVGSISLAPRATILVIRFVLSPKVGIGGATSDDDPLGISLWRDLGRNIVDARRSLFGLTKLAEPSKGAVCGVVGVWGMLGVPGTFPLMRES